VARPQGVRIHSTIIGTEFDMNKMDLKMKIEKEKIKA
jgi:hypothetical protein